MEETGTNEKYGTPGGSSGAEGTSSIQRRPEQDPPQSRKKFIEDLCDMVRQDKKHWAYAFKRMGEWQKFARGLQWPGMTKADLDDPDRSYTANVTMRHLKQRTASIYAKNPSYEWRRSRRVMHTRWDGTGQHLQMAQEIVQQGLDTTGLMQEVIADALRYQEQSNLFRRQGETLAVLYEYFMREQIPPTKKMMKKQVLASLTNGVAYIKQTFQRVTGMSPETTRAIRDHMRALARLETLAADLADDEIDENHAQAEELRLLITRLENQDKIVLREGLRLDYPDSRSIIPDRNMTYLPGFVGCGHVTEEFCLTPDEVKDVYQKDLADNYRKYVNNQAEPGEPGSTQRATCRVWEIWDRVSGLVYTVCDGYPDYLVEPHEPQSYTERFYPWFVYAPNAVDDDEDPFPPSDVELMMTQQMEINRAGEALREHRYAARPGWATGANVPEEDITKIEHRKAHALVVLKSLKPDEKIQDKFQAFPTANIDPNLYNTGPAFQDILRSTGSQEANLGGTSSSTATESSIAESSRQSTLTSAIDEFDDLLTEMARAGGQILFKEMSPEKVKEIVGPGAVWPKLRREEIAREIHLEVLAGSSGRPNQSQEVAVRERMYPLLFQLPTISHEKLAKDGIRVLDDGAIYEDWLDMSALPVMALNGQMQAQANRGAQSEGGADNADRPAQPRGTGPARPGQAGAAPQDSQNSAPTSGSNGLKAV